VSTGVTMPNARLCDGCGVLLRIIEALLDHTNHPAKDKMRKDLQLLRDDSPKTLSLRNMRLHITPLSEGSPLEQLTLETKYID